MHLDSKDDDATSAGDEVGAYQVVVLQQESLYHECSTANSHRDKPRQRYTICIARHDGLNSLRQVPQDETKSGYPTTNVNNQLMFHSTFKIYQRSRVVRKDTQKK